MKKTEKNTNAETICILSQGAPGSTKILMIDVESTLVKKHKDSKGPDTLLAHNVVSKIIGFFKDGYMIVLISSHGTRVPVSSASDKIKSFKDQLGIPILALGSFGGTGIFRKPCTGIWGVIEENNRDPSGTAISVNKSQCMYIGGASGQDNDNDIDIKFALNLGVEFMTPDQFFDGCKMKLKFPTHPLKGSLKTDKFDYGIFGRGPELVILVGPPCCGKSTFCENPVFKDHQVISPDKFKVRTKMITALINSQRSVIIDGRNGTRAEREDFVLAAKSKNYSVKIVHFNVSKALCKHLCVYREIIHSREVPLINITRYYSHLELDRDMIPFEYFIDESKISNKSLFFSFLN